MFDKRLPVQIDPVRFAEAGREMAGRMALAEMPRLVEALAAAEGAVEVELRFGVDDSGIRHMAGRLQATVTLVCQRCLEPFDKELDVALRLGLVASEGEAERLPAGYDPLQVGDGRLFLRDVIEDELLLALPQIARHEPDACQPVEVVEEPAAEADEAPRENPFAVLARLKEKD